jgi:hypothetical protein
VTNDLKTKIYNEILKTGFPLELRTADYLLNREYHVAHNVYFLDRDEQKGREIDLRALKNDFFEFATLVSQRAATDGLMI